MKQRAAVCVGVDRAGKMPPLKAAVDGAREFEAWAKAQKCSTRLLVGEASTTVTVKDILRAVRTFVDQGTYDQLIIYFSGHGILSAPQAEYWLLSEAPDDPNEAVNLSRSVVEARNSGIPHIVFVSDACRSSVQGRPLSGVTGGVIFPSRNYLPTRSEVDIFYATRAGDPAYEVPEAEATQRYSSIFTKYLLNAVKAPWPELVASLSDGTTSLSVIPSRNLKSHLEAIVPSGAGAIDIKLRQTPELLVETALPKFFATVDQPIVSGGKGRDWAKPAPLPTLDAALNVLHTTHYRETALPATAADLKLVQESGLAAEVEKLASARGGGHFESKTGFSVFGDAPTHGFARKWSADPAFPEPDNPSALHMRLRPTQPDSSLTPASVVIEFSSGTGALLAILPGFIGTVVLNDRRVVSVSYTPAEGTWRFRKYTKRAKKLEEMRAFAAVAARNGRFVVETGKASELARRIRQAKSIDPALGLYAAYAYAQAGAYEDVYSVFDYMTQETDEIPVPFDVVMLAGRFEKQKNRVENTRRAPFAPMLSQGWSLLMKGDALFLPIHQELRPHLVPSLWTTLDADGIKIARDAINRGDVT